MNVTAPRFSEVDALRRGFDKALKHPDLLADAKKLNLDLGRTP